MANTKNSKIFWSESNLNSPKVILKWKSRFRNKFPLWLFSRVITVFSKNGGRKSKKWKRQKKFVENLFLIWIDWNVPKRILKWMYRFRISFTIITFLWGYSCFLKNRGHSSKKWPKQKKMKIFFDRNRFKTV